MSFIPYAVGALLGYYLIKHYQWKYINERIEAGKRILNQFTAYDSIIRDVAMRYNINPVVLKIKIYWESNFKPNVVSSSGAVGISQMLPQTWSFVWRNLIGKEPPSMYDPVASIEAMGAYLRYLLDKFNNNYILAIASYNYGETNIKNLVKKYGVLEEIIKNLPFETKAYLYAVNQLADYTNV